MDPIKEAIEVFEEKLILERNWVLYEELFDLLKAWHPGVRKFFSNYTSQQKLKFFKSRPQLFTVADGGYIWSNKTYNEAPAEVTPAQSPNQMPGDMFLEFSSAVTLLLKAYSSINILNLKRIVTYVFDDIAETLCRLPPVQQDKLFQVIPDVSFEYNTLKLEGNQEPDTKNITKDDKFRLLAVSHLETFGSMYYQTLVEDVLELEPEELKYFKGRSASWLRNYFKSIEFLDFDDDDGFVSLLYDFHEGLVEYECLPAPDLSKRAAPPSPKSELKRPPPGDSEKSAKISSRKVKKSSRNVDACHLLGMKQVARPRVKGGEDGKLNKWEVAAFYLLNVLPYMHPTELAACISHALDDLDVQGDLAAELRKSLERSDLTTVDKYGFVGLHSYYDLPESVLSFEEAFRLYVVAYIGIRGKHHYVLIENDFKKVAPRVIRHSLTENSTSKLLKYYKSFPKYFLVDDDGIVKFTESFVFPDKKAEVENCSFERFDSLLNKPPEETNLSDSSEADISRRNHDLPPVTVNVEDTFYRSITNSISFLVSHFEVKSTPRLWRLFVLIFDSFRSRFAVLFVDEQEEVVTKVYESFFIDEKGIISIKSGEKPSYLSKKDKQLLYFSYSLIDSSEIHYHKLFELYEENVTDIVFSIPSQSKKYQYFKKLASIFSISNTGFVKLLLLPEIKISSRFFEIYRFDETGILSSYLDATKKKPKDVDQSDVSKVKQKSESKNVSTNLDIKKSKIKSQPIGSFFKDWNMKFESNSFGKLGFVEKNEPNAIPFKFGPSESDLREIKENTSDSKSNSVHKSLSTLSMADKHTYKADTLSLKVELAIEDNSLKEKPKSNPKTSDLELPPVITTSVNYKSDVTYSTQEKNTESGKKSKMSLEIENIVADKSTVKKSENDISCSSDKKSENNDSQNVESLKSNGSKCKDGSFKKTMKNKAVEKKVHDDEMCRKVAHSIAYILSHFETVDSIPQLFSTILQVFCSIKTYFFNLSLSDQVSFVRKCYLPFEIDSNGLLSLKDPQEVDLSDQEKQLIFFSYLLCRSGRMNYLQLFGDFSKQTRIHSKMTKNDKFCYFRKMGNIFSVSNEGDVDLVPLPKLELGIVFFSNMFSDESAPLLEASKAGKKSRNRSKSKGARNRSSSAWERTVEDAGDSDPSLTPERNAQKSNRRDPNKADFSDGMEVNNYGGSLSHNETRDEIEQGTSNGLSSRTRSEEDKKERVSQLCDSYPNGYSMSDSSETASLNVCCEEKVNGDWYALLQRIRDGVGFLVQTFRVKSNSNFLDIVFYVLNESEKYRDMPDSSRIAFIKHCLKPFCIGEGNVIDIQPSEAFTVSSLTAEEEDWLFISYVLNDLGEVHFEEVFRKFKEHQRELPNSLLTYSDKFYYFLLLDKLFDLTEEGKIKVLDMPKINIDVTLLLLNFSPIHLDNSDLFEKKGLNASKEVRCSRSTSRSVTSELVKKVSFNTSRSPSTRVTSRSVTPDAPKTEVSYASRMDQCESKSESSHSNRRSSSLHRKAGRNSDSSEEMMAKVNKIKRANIISAINCHLRKNGVSALRDVKMDKEAQSEKDHKKDRKEIASKDTLSPSPKDGIKHSVSEIKCQIRPSEQKETNNVVRNEGKVSPSQAHTSDMTSERVSRYETWQLVEGRKKKKSQSVVPEAPAENPVPKSKPFNEYDAHCEVRVKLNTAIDYLLCSFKRSLCKTVVNSAFYAMQDVNELFVLLPNTTQTELLKDLFKTFPYSKKSSKTALKRVTLKDEQKDLLILTYLLSRTGIQHYSKLFRTLKTIKSLPVRSECDSSAFRYFRDRSCFQINGDGFVRLVNFPPNELKYHNLFNSDSVKTSEIPVKVHSRNRSVAKPERITNPVADPRSKSISRDRCSENEPRNGPVNSSTGESISKGHDTVQVRSRIVSAIRFLLSYFERMCRTDAARVVLYVLGDARVALSKCSALEQRETLGLCLERFRCCGNLLFRAAADNTTDGQLLTYEEKRLLLTVFQVYRRRAMPYEDLLDSFDVFEGSRRHDWPDKETFVSERKNYLRLDVETGHLMLHPLPVVEVPEPAKPVSVPKSLVGLPDRTGRGLLPAPPPGFAHIQPTPFTNGIRIGTPSPWVSSHNPQSDSSNQSRNSVCKENTKEGNESPTEEIFYDFEPDQDPAMELLAINFFSHILDIYKSGRPIDMLQKYSLSALPSVRAYLKDSYDGDVQIFFLSHPGLFSFSSQGNVFLKK